jgi:hypothetical protein
LAADPASATAATELNAALKALTDKVNVYYQLVINGIVNIWNGYAQSYNSTMALAQNAYLSRDLATLQAMGDIQAFAAKYGYASPAAGMNAYAKAILGIDLGL